MAALVTRGSVWLAVLCYVVTVALRMRDTERSEMLGRRVWSLGCLLFLVHVAAAFHFYHQWSHSLAADETRRQTLEQTGVKFGGGIYFNYLFAAVWVGDCIGWWLGGEGFRARNPKWSVTLHSFFLFMIFNATVVFGHGMAKPAGAVVCVAVLFCLWRSRKGARFAR